MDILRGCARAEEWLQNACEEKKEAYGRRKATINAAVHLDAHRAHHN